MMHPTFDELQDRICKDTDDKQNEINSRFAIVAGVSKRARQLLDMDKQKDEKDKQGKKRDGVYASCKGGSKYLSIAIDEIYNQKIHIRNNKDIPEDTDLEDI